MVTDRTRVLQVRSLSETVRLDARTNLLIPKWYEGMNAMTLSCTHTDVKNTCVSGQVRSLGETVRLDAQAAEPQVIRRHQCNDTVLQLTVLQSC